MGALMGALVGALVGRLVGRLVGAFVLGLTGALVGALVTARARMDASLAKVVSKRKRAKIVATNKNLAKAIMVKSRGKKRKWFLLIQKLWHIYCNPVMICYLSTLVAICMTTHVLHFRHVFFSWSRLSLPCFLQPCAKKAFDMLFSRARCESFWFGRTIGSHL